MTAENASSSSSSPRRTLILVPPPVKDPDDLLNGREVATMLGVDVSWVKNHCTRVEPLLPHIKLGIGKNAKRRFKREHILQFIEENTRYPRSRKNGDGVLFTTVGH